MTPSGKIRKVELRQLALEMLGKPSGSEPVGNGK